MSRQGSSRSVRLTIAACTLIAFLIADRGVVFRATQAEGPTKPAAPRTLMRLPQWIESIGEVPARVRRRVAASETRPEIKIAAAPKPEASATGGAAFIGGIIDTRPIITPEAAAELGMPRRLPPVDAGKPGQAMLRSRGPRAVEGYVALTGGWADLSGEDAKDANKDARLVSGETDAADSGPSDDLEPAADGPATPRSSLGPETSVLSRDGSAAAPSTPATARDTTAAPAPAATRTSPDLPAVETAAESDSAETPTANAPNADEPAAKEPVAKEPVAGEPTPAEPAPGRLSTPDTVPPTAMPPEETPTLAIDPASFRGVLPGKTTREELLAGWGEGENFTREDGSSGLSWKIEPFERVEVVLERDTVSSIFIRLAQPVPVAELARQLEISDLRTVTVLDENGVSVGEVFPERGVIFSVKPGTHAAVAVMLEPLDAESFVLRAEADLEVSVANSLADLQYAVEIDPSHVRAHRLLLVILSDQGRWNEAAELAASACSLDPDDTWTHIKHASVLLALDRVDEAEARAEAILAKKGIPPLVTAQVERLLGRIELAKPAADYEKAVAHFSKAIKVSAPLATAKSQAIRRAALDLQLDSHLGTALAIAGGNWQQKARVLPKWIERSEGFANKLGNEVGGGDFAELRLCEGVLAAAARTNDLTEITSWVKRAMEVRSRLGERVTDPWRRRQIDWQVGQALNLALTSAQNRGESSELLENATLTAAYLERGSQMRQLTPKEQRALGDLFFRIGILHSLQNGDHATAVTWFDKTVPLWKENVAFERSGDLGRLGESYVSMAISYWQVEKREEAVELSRLGVDCMVEAVERKQLDERALAVAYGNLSTMYAEQGDNEQSKAYAEMASRAEATGTVIK